jgi:formylglycine-generating enzyme
MDSADANDYWLYPTQNNLAPDSDQPPGMDAPNAANTANIDRDDGVANGYNDGYSVSGSPNSNIYTETLLTDGGAYSLASSAYGTFDQAGNVLEWIDTIQGGIGSARVMRGGGYANGLGDFTVSSFQSGASPEDKFHSAHGFRLAMLPEPSTFVMAVLLIGTAAMPRLQRRQMIDLNVRKRRH